jgi:hypothetical protein
MKFKRNLGLVDRVLRTGVGLAMMYAGFVNQSLVADDVARLALGVMGIFMIAIALIGWCPMYGVIGFSTCSHKPESAS